MNNQYMPDSNRAVPTAGLISAEVSLGDKSKTSILSDKVYRYVVQAIEVGSISPGAKLRQDHLAQKLGVSNIPVREAFAKLEYHGLVERVPRKGACVKRFSADHIGKLYQARMMLEVGAIQDIAERITPNQLSELEKTINLMRTAHANNDVEAYLTADSHFHRTIIHYTGNEVLEQLFEPLIIQINTFMAMMQITQTAFYWNKDFDASDCMGHGSICRALAEHNRELAVAAACNNLKNACEVATMIMKAREAFGA